MESILQTITSNKILLIIVILLASLIIYSILKRLVKIIVILIIALALYLGYMNYKGDKTDTILNSYLNKWGMELKGIEKKKDSLSRQIDSINKQPDK